MSRSSLFQSVTTLSTSNVADTFYNIRAFQNTEEEEEEEEFKTQIIIIIIHFMYNAPVPVLKASSKHNTASHIRLISLRKTCIKNRI